MEDLSTKCSFGKCPEVHRGEGNQLVMSGPEISDPRLALDDHERAVEVPAVLVIDAVARLGGGMTWTDLERMFSAFTQSAFRFETLPLYAESGIGQESLEHFLTTGELLTQEQPNEWDQLVSAHREAGRSMRRVHTVRLPLSDYLRWELAFQHETSREEIRILNVDEHPEFARVERLGDAWIFDDRVGVRLCYDDEGSPTHPESLDSEQVGEYLAWRDKAWQVADPIADFMTAVS